MHRCSLLKMIDLCVFSVAKMEQLEAFRQKKAKERLDRVERIEKRLQQIRGQSASAAGRGTVQKPVARPPADSLLKDATNRVTSSSVVPVKRELPVRAKFIARRLKQSGNANKTSAGRRLTITLSVPSETNDTQAGEKCYSDSKGNAADENVPKHIAVSANVNRFDGEDCKPALGKR